MDEKELLERLQSVPYRYARTLAHDPHWYTLGPHESRPRDWQRAVSVWGSREAFEAVVVALRERATARPYQHKGGGYVTMRYYDANGYQYWTMGHPLRDTGLINRAPRLYRTGWDAKAQWYDAEIKFVEESAESKAWYGAVDIPRDGRVLDVGCGTGGLVDWRQADVDPARYVGLDVSGAMLALFAAKHPGFRDSLLRTSFEDFVDVGAGFDRVFALFGVASNVAIDMTAKVARLLLPGGVAVLTWFGEGDCRGKGVDKEVNTAPRSAEERLGFRVVEVRA